MPLASLLDLWKRDPDTAPNLISWRTVPLRPAQTHPFPDDLPAPVKQTLIGSGIHSSTLTNSKHGHMLARARTSSYQPAPPAERRSPITLPYSRRCFKIIMFERYISFQQRL